jgi:hypothetical protein
MRMSDILSAVDLTVYPIVALVIFTTIFGIVCVRIVRASKAEMREASAIPLDDDAVALRRDPTN